MKQKIRSLTYDAESRFLEYMLESGTIVQAEGWMNDVTMEVEFDLILDGKDPQKVDGFRVQFSSTLFTMNKDDELVSFIAGKEDVVPTVV